MRPATSASGIVAARAKGASRSAASSVRAGGAASATIDTIAVARTLRTVTAASALGDIHSVQRHADAAREFHSIRVCPEVDKKGPRTVVQHVIVNCSYLDPVLLQRLEHGADFGRKQNEIAG